MHLPPPPVRADVLYIIAVLAHILSKEEIDRTFAYLHLLLNEKGRLVFFEQTGPKEDRGEFWIRRTNSKYIEIAEKHGFKLITYTVITFSAHRFFERFIAKFYKKHFIRGRTQEEKCINANKSTLFRMISGICMFFSFFPLRKNSSQYGNTFFVFEK
jgi:hypothetical protein